MNGISFVNGKYRIMEIHGVLKQLQPNETEAWKPKNDDPRLDRDLQARKFKKRACEGLC